MLNIVIHKYINDLFTYSVKSCPKSVFRIDRVSGAVRVDDFWQYDFLFNFHIQIPSNMCRCMFCEECVKHSDKIKKSGLVRVG